MFVFLWIGVSALTRYSTAKKKSSYLLSDLTDRICLKIPKISLKQFMIFKEKKNEANVDNSLVQTFTRKGEIAKNCVQETVKKP